MLGWNVTCRFAISALEVTAKDGRVLRVPWTEVEPASGELGLRWRYRRENRLFGCLRVGSRGAAVARRLRDRAEWRDLNRLLKCPSFWRILGLYGLMSALILAVTFWGWWRVLSRLVLDTDVWSAMPPKARAVVIAVLVLMLLLLAVCGCLPMLLVWPYLAFRRRRPDIAGMRVTTGGLVCVLADGAQTRHRWLDVVSFDSGGRLVFRNCPEQPICLFAGQDSTWLLIKRQLQKIRLDACRIPSDSAQLKRVAVVGVAAGVCAEMLVQILQRAVDLQPPWPGTALGLMGAMAGVVWLARWLDRKLGDPRARRSRERAWREPG